MPRDWIWLIIHDFRVFRLNWAFRLRPTFFPTCPSVKLKDMLERTHCHSLISAVSPIFLADFFCADFLCRSVCYGFNFVFFYRAFLAPNFLAPISFMPIFCVPIYFFRAGKKRSLDGFTPDNKISFPRHCQERAWPRGRISSFQLPFYFSFNVRLRSKSVYTTVWSLRGAL